MLATDNTDQPVCVDLQMHWLLAGHSLLLCYRPYLLMLTVYGLCQSWTYCTH